MKTPLLSLVSLVLLASLVSLVFMASLASADCPLGDLNRDCKVNLFDFSLIAENWLEVEPNLPVGTVIINEAMAHSSDANGTDLPDWIELYNTSGSTINISGWYLADNDNNLINAYAYKIPNGTTIPPYGYLVFNESQFGTKFKLSENGDEVFLSLQRDGVPFGMDDLIFEASERNVSFGHYTTSIGEVKFVAMDSNTPGQLDSYPKVGPIVISEVMYYSGIGDPDIDDYEYIELYNIEDHAVNLWVWDPCTSSDLSWAITKGITYTFPYHTTMPAYSYLIVAENPTLCRSTFGIPIEVPVLGSFGGKLSNEGENVELSMPGELDTTVTPNVRYYICVDNVSYSDGQHHENFVGLDPWRTMDMANGKGESLQRINPYLYGDDVNNWDSESPYPGG